MFFVNTEPHSRRKFLRFQERVRKAAFSIWMSVEGRSNYRNVKAASSHFTEVTSTGPKVTSNFSFGCI